MRCVETRTVAPLSLLLIWVRCPVIRALGIFSVPLRGICMSETVVILQPPSLLVSLLIPALLLSPVSLKVVPLVQLRSLPYLASEFGLTGISIRSFLWLSLTPGEKSRPGREGVHSSLFAACPLISQVDRMARRIQLPVSHWVTGDHELEYYQEKTICWKFLGKVRGLWKLMTPRAFPNVLLQNGIVFLGSNLPWVGNFCEELIDWGTCHIKEAFVWEQWWLVVWCG